MRIVIVPTKEELGRMTADVIADRITKKNNLVLGLATGSTPEETYHSLVFRYKKGKIDFEHVRTVNLDEYCGLPAGHKQSFRYYMDQKLFSKVNIREKHILFLDGMAEDYDMECKRYDREIAALSGIDLQILGLGSNGHIAFNEPSDRFSEGTTCVKLTKQTIADNSRFFESVMDVPEYALTMGTKLIMKAKEIMVLATGKGKAEAVSKMLKGAVTPWLPASLLQRHENVTLYIDRELADFVKTVYGGL